MSIASNAGSEAAANEIIRYIDEKLRTEGLSAETRAELGEVRKKAAEIQDASQKGWY